MALGMSFIALMPGYPPDLSSYLFVNILSVTNEPVAKSGFVLDSLEKMEKCSKKVI